MALASDIPSTLSSEYFYEALFLRYGSVRKAAAATGLSKSFLHNLYIKKRKLGKKGQRALLDALSNTEIKRIQDLENYIPTLTPNQIRRARKKFAGKPELPTKAADYLATTTKPDFATFVDSPPHRKFSRKQLKDLRSKRRALVRHLFSKKGGGWNIEQIAKRIGVSKSTVSKDLARHKKGRPKYRKVSKKKK